MHALLLVRDVAWIIGWLARAILSACCLFLLWFDDVAGVTCAFSFRVPLCAMYVCRCSSRFDSRSGLIDSLNPNRRPLAGLGRKQQYWSRAAPRGACVQHRGRRQGGRGYAKATANSAQQGTHVAPWFLLYVANQRVRAPCIDGMIGCRPLRVKLCAA